MGREEVDRYEWPSAVECHFMFYTDRIPTKLLDDLNRAWVHRHGKKPATSVALWQVACWCSMFGWKHSFSMALGMHMSQTLIVVRHNDALMF